MMVSDLHNDLCSVLKKHGYSLKSFKLDVSRNAIKSSADKSLDSEQMTVNRLTLIADKS